jgi:hypothetical protein
MGFCHDGTVLKRQQHCMAAVVWETARNTPAVSVDRKLWQPCDAIAFAMNRYSTKEYKYYFLLFLEI